MYLVKRNKIFHLFYNDLNGCPKSLTTKSSKKTDALKFMSEFLRNQNKPINSKVITYKEFNQFYKKFSENRFSESYKEFIHYAFQQFGRVINENILLNEITINDVEKFIQLKLSEAGNRIVNGYLRTMQGAFQRAIEFEFIQNNVFGKVKKMKLEEKTPLFLSKSEFERVIKAEEDSLLRTIYNVAVYTGMRMAEIRFLKWSSVDFSNLLFTIKNHDDFTTKSKKSRIIPMHKILNKLLRKLHKKNNDNEYVFLLNKDIIKRKYISARFKNSVIKAGLNPEYHFHSLRHTFASWLVQNGVSIYIVKELLGHSDVRTTQIYSHLSGSNFTNAVNLLE